MNPFQNHLQNQTRRHFLQGAGVGLGSIALSSLLEAGPKTPANPLAEKKAHFPGKAKRVIYLHMTGSPPNLDLFDY